MNSLYNNIDSEIKKRLPSEMEKLNEEDKKKILKKIKKEGYLAFFSCSLGLFALVGLILEWYSNIIFLSVVFASCLIFCLILAFIMKFIYNKNSDKVIETYIKNKVKKEVINKYLNNKENVDASEINLNFNPTKTINLGTSGFKSDLLVIDSNSSQLKFKKGNEYSKIYSFKDILNYEVYENGNSVIKGTAGKSLIGGIFFGLGGMIVAGNMKKNIKEICTELKLVIRINDINNPQLTLTYINSNTKKSGFIYKTLKENLRNTCSALEFIINNKELSAENETRTNIPVTKKEQLTELQELLTDGLITEEEFKSMKREILGLQKQS